MQEIVGVRFKKLGKIYFFDPDGIKLNKNQNAIVETARGLELGEVAIANRMMDEDKLITALKKVVRIATKEDEQIFAENEKKAQEAYAVCEEKIKKHGLDMKLIDVEYTFDSTKLLFYFTAEGRIDFRDLVKDLAAIYKTRIELRQIGVRDEVKMLGGYGMCGRELCCCNHLGDLNPVSIKMAKEQGLSLNPSKISGVCGRLMCCLKHEQEVYEDKLSRLPNVGALVNTPEGKGTVEDVQVLKEIVTVKIENGDDKLKKSFNASEIEILKNSKKREIRNEEEIDFKELKQLEEGFKRQEDI
ncbi:MAG: stage 0 sporulation family protein [Clostridia bacterium]|nr:stage 0 sporulation family protein [Clostridia bacterium]